MAKFIQLHLLTNYGPSNPNRDDLGRPKTAKVGGVDRLRISSQCLKRSWRTSELFEDALSGHVGSRTKLIGVDVYNKLKASDVKEKDAIKWAQDIAQCFGKLKTVTAGKKTDNESDDEEQKKQGHPLIIENEALVHVSVEEKKLVADLTDKLCNEKRAPLSEELELLRKNTQTVDIALWGRMLASKPTFNVEAAVQVAHAVTVNRVIIEDDYFTAVDDLNNSDEDLGSAHIGDTAFGSGVFYNYICINYDLLVKNLAGDADLAIKSIQSLTECAAKVSPTGKQNSYASRALSSYILAEKGTQQPRQLSSAFLKPINDSDMIDESVKKITTLYQNMDNVYGKCADDRYTIHVENGVGNFQDLLKFLSE